MADDLRIRLLIVDDEQSIRKLCMTVGEGLGYACMEAESGEAALALLEELPAHMVLTDLVMPNMSGLEFLEKLKKLLPRTEVAVMTGHGSVETAVQAMKLGAYDYISKPFSPLEELRLFLRRMAEKIQLVEENQFLRDRVDMETDLHGIVGTSAKIQDVLRNRPFVAVDCGSLMPTLIESELFGYEKGAFTGAMRSKPGLFQSANGGAIFLDEIGELPLEMQAKLLRVLQEKEVRPVGSNQKIKVDVRIIAATNRDLEAEYRNGTFRKDLYFRLNVVTVHLPSLRERRYCVERAVALGDRETIDVCDLPPSLIAASSLPIGPAEISTAGLSTTDLEAIERTTIERVFQQVGGDKVRAGKMLGISRATLYRKLKRYNIGIRVALLPGSQTLQ